MDNLNPEHDASPGHIEMPFVSPRRPPIFDARKSADQLLVPFSTPGPASLVSAITPSSFPLGSTDRSTGSFLVALNETAVAEDDELGHFDSVFAHTMGGPDSDTSGQPASPDVVATNAHGDVFGASLGGDDSNFGLSIPKRSSSLENIARIHSTEIGRAHV